MSKTLGLDKDGNQTIKFLVNGNKYELGIFDGDFVLYTNQTITHNLGSIEKAIETNDLNIADALAFKANAASPELTGTTTMALAIYADDAAAITGGLVAGQLYQVTDTGVVHVVVEEVA